MNGMTAIPRTNQRIRIRSVTIAAAFVTVLAGGMSGETAAWAQRDFSGVEIKASKSARPRTENRKK